MREDDLSDREIPRLAYIAKAMFCRPDIAEQLSQVALDGPVPGFDSKRFTTIVHDMNRMAAEAWQSARPLRENFIRAILQNADDVEFDPSASPEILAAAFLRNAAQEQDPEAVAALSR